MKVAHFIGCSLGMWLLRATQIVSVTQRWWTQLTFLSTKGAQVQVESGQSWGKTHGFLLTVCLSYIPVISFRLPYSTRRYELLSLFYRWRHWLKKGRVPCPGARVSEYQRHQGNLWFCLRRKPLMEKVIWRGPQCGGGLSIRDLLRSTFQREWAKLRPG